MDKFNIILNFLIKKNLISLAMFVGTTAVVVLASIYYVVPEIQSAFEIKEQNKVSIEKVDSLKEQISKQEQKVKQEASKVQKVPVAVFKSPKPNMPVESTSIDLVTDLIKKLERTNNSIVDISYKISTPTQPDIPSNISIVQLNMTLNSSYTDFQDFLFEMYDGKYISTIKAIKMVPLKENKKLLEINTEVWLYISK